MSIGILVLRVTWAEVVGFVVGAVVWRVVKREVRRARDARSCRERFAANDRRTDG